MERTEQGEQAGNRSRKAAQTEDFDTKMTSLTGPLSPPHAHTLTHTTQQLAVPVLVSAEVGLALTHVAGCYCLSHPGTFLSVPARRGSVCQRELAGTRGGIWWATPAHGLPYCNRGL